MHNITSFIFLLSLQILHSLDNNFLGLSVTTASSNSGSSNGNSNSLGIMTTTSMANGGGDMLSASGQQQQQHMHQQHQDDGLSSLVQEGKARISEFRSGLKATEQSHDRLSAHFSRTQSEVAKAFHVLSTALEERRAEVARELEAQFSAKQLALSLQRERTRDALEKVAQISDYAEQLAAKSAQSAPPPSEAAAYRKALEQRLHAVVAAHQEANGNMSAEDVADFDFVGPSYATAQGSIKSAFGYVRARSDSGNSTNSSGGSNGNGGNSSGHAAPPSSSLSSVKQPPISRPISSSGVGSGLQCNGVGGALGLSPLMANGGGSGNGSLAAGILAAGAGNSSSQSTFNGMAGLSGSLQGLLDRHTQQQQQHSSSSGAKALQTPPAAGGGFHQFHGGHHNGNGHASEDIFSKRGGSGFAGPSSSSSSNPYEKWSDGSGGGGAHKLLGFGGGGGAGAGDPASVAAAAAAQAVAAAAHHAHLAALSR